MTWSERQAIAKKQAEEEEERSRAAGSAFKPTHSPSASSGGNTPSKFTSSAPAFGRSVPSHTGPRNFGALAGAAVAGAAVGAVATAGVASLTSRYEAEPQEEEWPAEEEHVAAVSYIISVSLGVLFISYFLS